MPCGKHAAQHLDGRRQARQDRTSASSARLRRAAFCGSLALAAAFSLLIAMAAMRAVGNRGNPAAFLIRNCSLAPRLVANDSATVTPLGVNASGVSQLATATAQFGHMPVIRAYYAGIPSQSQWSTGVLGRSNSSVVVSFRPAPTEIISGADDAALAHFFDAAPTGHVIYYSYYHEPEAHIKDGQFTLAQYKAAWARVVTIADEAHNPYLHSTLILQGQDARPGDEYNFRDYLPSGGIISTLGWDAYPVGTVPNENPQPTPPDQFMGPDVSASKSVGLPFGFAEFALGTQTDRPQWLTDVANYLDSNGALFGTLFDAAGFPWMVLHDSASIQAWRTAVARSDHTMPAPFPSSTSASRQILPTAVPIRSKHRRHSPATRGLMITRLKITPPALSVTGVSHVRIRFKLSQAAHVSICVLNSHGDVVRELPKGSLPAGWATAAYYGYDQHRRPLPAAGYQVIVTASNATGTATAQWGLALTGDTCGQAHLVRQCTRHGHAQPGSRGGEGGPG